MKDEGWILSVPKEHRLSAIRAHVMAQGKPLVIQETCPYGKVHKFEERAMKRKQKPDFRKLIESYNIFTTQGGRINQDTSWKFEGKNHGFK